MEHSDLIVSSSHTALSPTDRGDLQGLKAQIRKYSQEIRQDPDLIALFVQDTSPADIAEINAYARRRLSEDVVSLKKEKTVLERTAQNNLTLQTQTHKAVLALMEVQILPQLDYVIRRVLPLILNLEEVHIVLEGAHAPRTEACTALTWTPSGLTESVLPACDYHLGQVSQTTEQIYEMGHMIKSEALARLSLAETQGFVAFGSRHAKRFNPSQNPGLLEFLTRVLERRLHDVLPL